MNLLKYIRGFKVLQEEFTARWLPVLGSGSCESLVVRMTSLLEVIERTLKLYEVLFYLK